MLYAHIELFDKITFNGLDISAHAPLLHFYLFGNLDECNALNSKRLTLVYNGHSYHIPYSLIFELFAQNRTKREGEERKVSHQGQRKITQKAHAFYLQQKKNSNIFSMATNCYLKGNSIIKLNHPEFFLHPFKRKLKSKLCFN